MTDVETLQLTGASTAVLGPFAGAAGLNRVVTGNGNTNITLNNATPTTIDASAMPDTAVLTLGGSGAFTVTGLVAELNALGASGTLVVETAANTSSEPFVAQTIVVTTGSGATTVTATTAGDTVTVDAAALAGAETLT
ncbi:hypothetical protein, partial [Aphanothece microscopica]|uniref:hypothetical protein n=1 Tax=Aphanothece microscopica TaxID=1049561 RepID=UPI003CE4862B